jgi:hypothetical protein
MINFNFLKKNFIPKNKAKYPKETKEQTSKKTCTILKAKNKSKTKK